MCNQVHTHTHITDNNRKMQKSVLYHNDSNVCWPAKTAVSQWSQSRTQLATVLQHSEEIGGTQTPIARQSLFHQTQNTS